MSPTNVGRLFRQEKWGCTITIVYPIVPYTVPIKAMYPIYVEVSNADVMQLEAKLQLQLVPRPAAAATTPAPWY